MTKDITPSAPLSVSLVPNEIEPIKATVESLRTQVAELKARTQVHAFIQPIADQITTKLPDALKALRSFGDQQKEQQKLRVLADVLEANARQIPANPALSINVPEMTTLNGVYNYTASKANANWNINLITPEIDPTTHQPVLIEGRPQYTAAQLDNNKYFNFNIQSNVGVNNASADFDIKQLETLNTAVLSRTEDAVHRLSFNPQNMQEMSELTNSIAYDSSTKILRRKVENTFHERLKADVASTGKGPSNVNMEIKISNPDKPNIAYAIPAHEWHPKYVKKVETISAELDKPYAERDDKKLNPKFEPEIVYENVPNVTGATLLSTKENGVQSAYRLKIESSEHQPVVVHKDEPVHVGFMHALNNTVANTGKGGLVVEVNQSRKDHITQELVEENGIKFNRITYNETDNNGKIQKFTAHLMPNTKIVFVDDNNIAQSPAVDIASAFTNAPDPTQPTGSLLPVNNPSSTPQQSAFTSSTNIAEGSIPKDRDVVKYTDNRTILINATEALIANEHKSSQGFYNEGNEHGNGGILVGLTEEQQKKALLTTASNADGTSYNVISIDGAAFSIPSNTKWVTLDTNGNMQDAPKLLAELPLEKAKQSAAVANLAVGIGSAASGIATNTSLPNITGTNQQKTH